MESNEQPRVESEEPQNQTPETTDANYDRCAAAIDGLKRRRQTLSEQAKQVLRKIIATKYPGTS